MTTDSIQYKHARKHIGTFHPHIKGRSIHSDAASGFELTRLQNFLEGRQDIFDVLESHAANKETDGPDNSILQAKLSASRARSYNPASIFDEIQELSESLFSKLPKFGKSGNKGKGGKPKK